MRIAVVGAGGVGAYFGARLVEAGVDVVFIARGEHLAALRERGLDLKSPGGDVAVAVTAVKEPREAGAVDAVLLAVKAFQVRDAASSLGPLLGKSTFVVPVENGVEAASEVGGLIGRERVVPGLARISSFLEGPGRVRHAGIDPVIELGEVDGKPSARVQAFAAAFDKAKAAKVKVAADIEVALWEKFLFIAPVSGVASVARLPIGDLRESPETRVLLLSALDETFAVGRAHGVRLSEEAIPRTISFFDGVPPSSVPSMARDIASGKPSELEYQTGAVVRLGREKKVPTPVNTFLYACLVPGERKAKSQGVRSSQPGNSS